MMTDSPFPTRRRLFGTLAAAGGLALLPRPLRALAPLDVAGPEALSAALAAAGPGAVLRLAPGDYGHLVLRGIGGSAGAPVTLLAADPARPPRVPRMDLRDAAHVVLEGLHFDYTFAPGDKIHFRPFSVVGGRDITLRGCLFDGDRARGVSAVDDGFGWAFGLGVTVVDGIRLERCEIRDFFRGLVIEKCRGAVVEGCDLHDLRMDGINCVQVQDLRIEGNHIRDFNRSLDSEDHADMIQFWTTRTDVPSTDIVIRGNLLSSGRGGWTQSIFMRNEEVDQGRAGRGMFYRNVLIEENVILNAHLHGISVGETEGLVIRRNTLLRNRQSEGREDNPRLWTPRINVNDAAQDVTIARNVTGGIAIPDGQRGWHVESNVIVQDRTRLEPGFVGLFFEGDPADPATLRHRPGGPLDRAGIGAAMLQRD